ncbi:MAG: response regulator transcription factor [Chlorobiaceae bacterium]|nr:response regulator transcription factor [Chlorobiaceae bacterium]NTW73488.1 response regulator transcription factor [Chlorobiaceae bacterium]
MTEHKQIIVVEDDRDFRESMVEYLLLAGYDVTGVGSALEFYQAIARDRFLLAILDIGLPDQDGFVLAEYIRKNSEMRIVMLTAQSSLDSKINAYRSGADTYLVKPIDFAELAASLDSMIGRLNSKSADDEQPTPIAPLHGGKTEHWRLMRSEHSLFAPNGNMTALTSKEFDLLEQLAASPKTVVERRTLLQTLVYDDDDLGNRALDALIHRLRRKKEDLGLMIPVKTVHGSGYSFSELIVIE